MLNGAEINELYQALQTSLGWYDLGAEEEIFCLNGPGHVEFLNQYNTQNILKMQPGEVSLGCFLTQKGKLIAPTVILKQKEAILLIWPKGLGEKILKHLEIYLNFADCSLKDVTADWIHGVFLGKTPQGLFSEIYQSQLWKQESFKLDETEIIAWQTDRFGFSHGELLIPSSAQDIWKRTLQAMKLIPLKKTFLEALRIEAGLPKWGVDMNETNLVAEVGLDKRATSFNKGCYLGQETTARIESQGHTNYGLKRLRLKKLPSLSLPLDLLQGEQKVGRLTSAALSPNSDKVMGLGLIHRKADSNDEAFPLEVEGEKIQVKIIS